MPLLTLRTTLTPSQQSHALDNPVPSHPLCLLDAAGLDEHAALEVPAAQVAPHTHGIQLHASILEEAHDLVQRRVHGEGSHIQRARIHSARSFLGRRQRSLAAHLLQRAAPSGTVAAPTIARSSLMSYWVHHCCFRHTTKLRLSANSNGSSTASTRTAHDVDAASTPMQRPRTPVLAAPPHHSTSVCRTAALHAPANQ
jgi:hypothetical protein